jgi:formiminotetrahydrofolate cyclodeaminase
MTPFAELTVAGFAEAVAAREPAPSGGAVAAVTVAGAAGLVAMAARFSGALDGAGDIATAADGLRTDVLALADADAEAYGAVLAAYRLPADRPGRRQEIRSALGGAATVPLRIAASGARVAALAADLATRGNPNLAGDAHTAVLLAEAATRAAARLVRINVELGRLDEAVAAEADAHAAAAADAARDAPA